MTDDEGTARDGTDWRALWDFQDPVGSESRFRALLAGLDDGAPLDLRLVVETQLARSLGLQGRYEEAHAVLDAVDARLPAAGDEPRVRALLERGRTHNGSGAPRAATPSFREAWAVARHAGLQGLAMDAAHMLAIAEEPEEALAWAWRAIELAEASEDEAVRSWLGPLYNNTGWTYEERGEYDQAMALFVKGLEVRLERGWTREAVIALYTVAHMHRLQGRTEQALVTIEDVASRWRDLGLEPDGYTHEELGETLLALDRAEEARDHFRQAHEMLAQDDWLVAHEPERLARLERLGR